MKNLPSRERGAALFVSLIMLALLMVIGATSIDSGVVDARIISNGKLVIDSFQKADAGIGGTISLIGTPSDPFDGEDHTDVLGSADPTMGPVLSISGLSVNTTLTRKAGSCGHSERASSNRQIGCEFYEITSQHSDASLGVSSTIVQGMRREVIVN